MGLLFIVFLDEESYAKQMTRDLQDANFIFVLYDMHREETKLAVRDKWIPKILEVRKDNVVCKHFKGLTKLQPMIGVLATKADKDEDELPQEELKPIAEWHPVCAIHDASLIVQRI